jgi:tetratricopeptide (TPR) repeat protein
MTALALTDRNRAVARHARTETLARRHRIRAPGRSRRLAIRLAWDLLRLIRTDFSEPKDKYIASVTPVRLDAEENFIRGMLATTVQERLQRYREATRLNPDYARAWLELGKTLYAQHAYEPAIAALSQVQHSASVAREATFYLGLAAYDHGDLEKSESAFEFVAARLPLAEVYNNLGVVAAQPRSK